MDTKRKHRWVQVVVWGCGGPILLQGCPIGSLFAGFVDSCFGEDTISASEYDDLNLVERLLYEENDCGRFEMRSL